MMIPPQDLPDTDVERVVAQRTKEWHFHIYFLTQSPAECEAALKLRDAVLRLRRDVPLHRVNKSPMGPHPAGSYEIWVPDSSFSDVFFYLAANRGDLSLPIQSELPLQYPELGLGWSNREKEPSIAERAAYGKQVEELLSKDPEAAPAPV
nr:uncharacterized protein CI109_004179 [Kwoniella shandongensis]KAA5527367.1 hypothetical protein CI109_004179 [Kwoniella shandongensis]